MELSWRGLVCSDEDFLVMITQRNDEGDVENAWSHPRGLGLRLLGRLA